MLGTRMFLRRGGCPRCRDGRVGDGDEMGGRDSEKEPGRSNSGGQAIFLIGNLGW